MSNELLLIIQLVMLYGGVVAFYWLFGNKGLMMWTVIATIAANIEVLVMVDAFGMSQTMGNIMFATTFVVTDILNEVAGKKKAQEAVNIGIATSIAFIVITQFWLLFTPNAEDWAMSSLTTIFTGVPRMMFAGLLVYAIVQKFDVWLYSKAWKVTSKWLGNNRKMLWFRCNISTLISQFLNAVLFAVIAFYGTYDNATLVSIIVASYIIFIVTSVADTPFIYLARKLKDAKKCNIFGFSE